VYSTYLGGSNDEEAFGLALDANGNAYIAGLTFSFSDSPPRALNNLNSGAEFQTLSSQK
jgi:Beta-propeller repeat